MDSLIFGDTEISMDSGTSFDCHFSNINDHVYKVIFPNGNKKSLFIKTIKGSKDDLFLTELENL